MYRFFNQKFTNFQPVNVNKLIQKKPFVYCNLATDENLPQTFLKSEKDKTITKELGI